MLLLILPSAGIIVVILPLTSLKYDIMCCLNYIGLRHKVWERTEDKVFRCPLVFILVNKAISCLFSSYLNCLKARNMLNRVVFNKSYLTITTS